MRENKARKEFYMGEEPYYSRTGDITAEPNNNKSPVNMGCSGGLRRGKGQHVKISFIFA